MRHLNFGVCLVLLILVHTTASAERLAVPLKEQAKIIVGSASAQTLYSIETVDVDSDYSWESVEYYSIRINDLQAARDYGRITIGYNHYYSELELEFANVLTPNGEIKSVKADAMQERGAGSQDFYEDRSLLVFSLPEIVPGSIMEFQYRRKSVKLPMPGIFNRSSSAYWYQPTVGGDGGRVDPVYSAVLEINAPENLPLKSKFVGPYKPKHKKKSINNKVSHRWEWKQLPLVVLEASMPPIDEIMSRVRVSSSDDWVTVDRWVWGLAKDKFAQNKHIKKIAESLVTDTATREEKIKAVYAYVQENIRYVFAHLGRGGYEPHFANEVIQQRYGDCKDQTILAVALLKEMGVQAYPSLVITQRSGKPDMELVALYFDHMVVWIPGEHNDTGMWMDTTADRALFPGMSNYLLDQSAFIIDGKGGRLTSIDSSRLPENIGKLEMNYFVDDNDHLIVDVTTRTSGIYEQSLRSWWIHDNNRETSLQQMMSAIFPDAKGKAKIDNTVLNEDNLWEPFTIKTRFDFGSAREEKESTITYGVGVLQAYRIFGDINSLQIPKERKNRWVNNQLETIQIQAHLSGAAGDLPAVVSSGVDINRDYFTIKQQGKQTDNVYNIDIRLDHRPLNLSTAQYDEYYQALNNMAEAGHWLVSYMSDTKQEELAKVISEANSSDFQAQLKLARYYLDQGQFEKALEPANTAVNLDNKNGEAWYILGIVQGYNAMVDESMTSFNEASNLGYAP